MPNRMHVLRPVQDAVIPTLSGADAEEIAIRDGLRRAASTLFQDAKRLRVHGMLGMSEAQHRAGVTCLRESVRMTAEFLARDTHLRELAVKAG
jgi:hypothetical protein